MNPIKRFSYKVLNRLLFSGRYGSIALRKSLLDFLPDKIDLYVDVGAFDGDFYEIISGEQPVAKALLIEPQEKYFRELAAKYADDKRVTLSQCVLLAETKPVTFYVNTMNATSSALPADEQLLGAEIDISGNAVQTESKTLDEVCAPVTGSIDLLKIDVQGAELDVLKGGVQTLKRTQLAWIEVSFKPLYKGQALFGDILHYMESQGFVMINIFPGFKGKSGELLQADCLFKKLNA